MRFFKIESWLDVLKHVGIVLGLGLIITLFFFYIYLPTTTNHGESVTVPDLVGMPLSELDEFVVQRDLRFEVSDSSYSSEYPPLTVLHQFPKAGSEVKENRKIFISLNSKTPPSTVMPNLIDKTVQNAELILKSHELKRGRITTQPDEFRNVLEQHYNGEPVEPGTRIPKGSVVELVIGDGHGISQFEMPSLLGLPLEEAEVIIKGNSLNVGIVFNQDENTPEGYVIIKQSPAAGNLVRVDSEVDLWLGDPVELPDTTSVN
ncbi:MAG: PASTA domain-containing protein [Cyclobacteriaceae bacterium]|nr:PASTA domain-containing protein [Cyclobacteriaceae bacterium]